VPCSARGGQRRNAVRRLTAPRVCAARSRWHPRRRKPRSSRYPTWARNEIFVSTRKKNDHAKKTDARRAPTKKLPKPKSVFRAVPCDVVEPPAPRRPKNSPRRVVERGEREKSAVRRPTSPSFLCPRPLGRILAFSAAPPAHHAARDRTRAPPRRRRAPRVTQGWRDGPLRRARATVRLEPAPGPIRARAVRPDFKRPTAPGGIGMAR
jgi:hypothetical protein